jgi:hypothetical protein
MNTIKNENLQRLQGYLKIYNEQLERATKILEALEDYDKKTINKTFFEKYFSWKNEKGELIRTWKGDISTDVHFSDKQFTWSTYHKRIFIGNSEYIEVQNTDKSEVLQATKIKIGLLQTWISDTKIKMLHIEEIDEEAILQELKEIKQKHKTGILWSELLEKAKYID